MNTQKKYVRFKKFIKIVDNTKILKPGEAYELIFDSMNTISLFVGKKQITFNKEYYAFENVKKYIEIQKEFAIELKIPTINEVLYEEYYGFPFSENVYQIANTAVAFCDSNCKVLYLSENELNKLNLLDDETEYFTRCLLYVFAVSEEVYQNYIDNLDSNRKISLDKKYKTKKSDSVIVHSLNGLDKNTPVVYEVLINSRPALCRADIYGKNRHSDDLNLIEIK